MTTDQLRAEITRPNLWAAETVRRAAAAHYLASAHAHRLAAREAIEGSPEERAHLDAADTLDIAYWAELDELP